MLKSIYRAMVLSRAKSAAHEVLKYMDDQTLADIGHSRHTFVEASVKNVMVDFDNAQKEKTAPVNPNLVGAV